MKSPKAGKEHWFVSLSVLVGVSAVVLVGAMPCSAQVPIGILRSKSEVKAQPPPISLPTAAPSRVPYSQEAISPRAYRPGFLKNLTIDSFGYDLSSTGQGFEKSELSAGPFTAHGLECPYCVQYPLMTRSRFTLEPFGSQGTLHSWGGRSESFVGLGGVEAWLPDSSLIPYRRATTFNDAWLAQTQGGSSVAIDPGRHVWLGATGRYLENFGQLGRKHWNTFGGTASFRFGRDNK